MDSIKTEFAKHLASLGFDFQSPPEVILGKLRKLMGEQRFQQFQARRVDSTASQEETYKLFQDIIEGNLMRSLDTNATLDASFSLYQRCASRIEPSLRIMELGCWTGGLASFIAARHPNCSVVGVDFSPEVIKACYDYYRLPNLSFQRWNYRWGKPEPLEPADVLLCAMGVVHHLPSNTSLTDPRAVRGSKEYITQRDHAFGYFCQWRTAVKEGGFLYAALRVRLFTRFLAWADAAHEAGWTLHLNRLWHVDMTGEKVPLPGLVFEARRSEPLPEEAIIDQWTWFIRRNHFYACVEGGPAIAAFRALVDKKVLATREYRRNDGLLTRDEVGLAGGSAYVFTNDALCQFRLLLVSHHRAKELAAGISAKGSNTPITDEGAFQSAATALGVANTISGGAFFSGAQIPAAAGSGPVSAFSGGSLRVAWAD